MDAIKNILLLTDFSENAKNAIDYALEKFKNRSCMFHILNVHKMGSFTTDDLMLGGSNNVHDSIVNKPKKQLELLVADLKSTFNNPNHQFSVHIDFDDFTDAINQVVKSQNIDLVVLGTNGKTGAKEILFGSNSLDVIRHVQCTTLLIPEHFKYQPTKTVLLPLNNEDSMQNPLKTKLKEFINTDNKRLIVLRINDNKQKDYKQLDESNLNGLNYEYHTINNVPAHYAIHSFIQIESVDLIAIIAKKEGFFKRLFSESSINKLSEVLHLPLLVFHNT